MRNLISLSRYLALKIFKIYTLKFELNYFKKTDLLKYAEENNINEKYSNLIKGLDSKSKLIIETVLFRTFKESRIVNSFALSNKELLDISKINGYEGFVGYNDISFSPNYYKNLFPGFSDYEISVFKFHNGLSLLPIEANNYFESKDCIDVGGYEGDSAVVFASHYNFKKIYSLEVDKKNYNRAINILSTFYKHYKNIEIINKGLWNEKGHGKIIGTEEGNMGTKVSLSSDNSDMELIMLDNFIKENNVVPGFIKLDIEGAEIEALLGAKKTIKEFNPILAVSIYHNPRDFFEIKPLIEDIAPNQYNFYVRKLTPFYNPQETYLICIPKKLNLKIEDQSNIEIYG